MDYKDFKEQVVEQIKDFLPEKFADADVEIRTVIKNNDCKLDGLCIRTDETNIFPTIYLDPYYAKMQSGAEMGEILETIAACYQEHYVDQKLDAEKLLNYDNVKDRIICKLVNEEANREYLENIPYMQMEDLAVVYQVLMNQDEQGRATITITDNLLEQFDVSLEDIHRQALENMETLQKCIFHGINETVVEMLSQEMAETAGMSLEEAKEMAASMMSEAPEVMYVLTNESKVGGAALILNDAVRQEIAEKLGDFYVLPSSVHEVLIVPKDTGLDRQELEQMVREVNRTEVAEHEVLSGHIYEYDAKEHELFRSDRAEERAQHMEKQAEEKSSRPSLKEKLAEKQREVSENEKGREKPELSKKKEAAL